MEKVCSNHLSDCPCACSLQHLWWSTLSFLCAEFEKQKPTFLQDSRAPENQGMTISWEREEAKVFIMVLLHWPTHLSDNIAHDQEYCVIYFVHYQDFLLNFWQSSLPKNNFFQKVLGPCGSSSACCRNWAWNEDLNSKGACNDKRAIINPVHVRETWQHTFVLRTITCSKGTENLKTNPRVFLSIVL